MGAPRSSIRLAMIVGFFVGLWACSVPNDRWPAPPRDDYVMASKSTQIEADVFFDATLSMQGFAIPGIATDYARVLDRIEGSITTGWQNSVVKFSKFGTKITELSEREQRDVIKPVFYNDPEMRGVTSIDKVIDAAETDHLTIIVSDLFQSDADVTQVVNRIKGKLASEDISVGLLGVQSEFDGTIFDVGRLQDKFLYRGQRPFYILMLGKHRDVEHLYNSLAIRILNEVGTKQFTLLSRNFSDPLPTFDKAKVSKKNIDTTTSILSRGDEDSRVIQLRLRRGDPEASLSLSLHRTPLSYTLGLDPSDLGMDIVVKKGRISGKKKTLVDYPEPLGLLNTSIGISESALEMRITIDGNLLDATGLYIVEQTIFIKENANLVPEWVSLWDMNLIKLPEWKQLPKTFEGNTTLNLKTLALDLFQSIVQVQRPTIAHLFYYIRKE